jgi:hypothetical protein
MCFSKKIKTLYGCKIDRRKIPGLPTDSAHEQAIQILVDKFAEKFKLEDVRATLGKITMEWWNDIAPRPSTGELNTVVVHNGQIYSGLTVGSVCKVAWRGKLYRSAFAHEIAHQVSWKLFSDWDENHKNGLLWEIVRIINEEYRKADI